MGSGKVTLIRDEATRKAFSKQLLQDVKSFEKMLHENLFETDTIRIGAEQELCFVDKHWRPAPVIMEILPLLNHPNFTTEYAKFNIEFNLDPVVFNGDALKTLENQILHHLNQLKQVSNETDIKIIQTGILPTIRRSDVNANNITPIERYHILTEILHELRGGMFNFHIEGTDQLIDKEGFALYEACNTSFQVHLQVSPQDFVQQYNWAQAIAAPMMSVAVNSPLFLGKRLWKETRIALFKQSIDFRNDTELRRSNRPRVSFGTDWIKNSVLDLHRDNIARYKVLLASSVEENSLDVLKNGGIPNLRALNIHNGTIYRWNRPCYGISDTGQPHLRIENRIIPAGPSTIDQMANAAFWLGMMKGIPEEYKNLKDTFEFDTARGNFYKAAKQGMMTAFNWIGLKRPITAQELILKELIPIAKEGLQQQKIDTHDIDKYLGIIQERTETCRTGARWLLGSFEKLRKQHSVEEALVMATADLYQKQQTNQPVHTWNLTDQPTSISELLGQHKTVEQIMTTDLFIAHEWDTVNYIANVMDWSRIRHLPVENKQGALVGLISSRQLLKYFSDIESADTDQLLAKDIMETQLITVTPETELIEALDLMKAHKIGCLPIVEREKLLGIVTEHDFLPLTQFLLKQLQRLPLAQFKKLESTAKYNELIIDDK